MNATLLSTPVVLGVGVPTSFSHGTFLVGSGDGAATGAEPSRCEPSKSAQNGPLPWIAAGCHVRWPPAATRRV